MGKDTIHVAIALNDYFVMPYGVMLTSLFETNKMNQFHVHVFSGELNDNSIQTLKSITDKYNADFTFYNLEPKLFDNLAVSARISNVTYYRDVIPGLMNPVIEKILYLDGDMIVLDDVKPLWEINIDGYILAAVDDMAAMMLKDNERMNIPPQYGYFNSGTFLINRKEWVDNNTSEKILTYTRENIDLLKYLDQDAENFIICMRRKVLPPKWNQQVGIYFCNTKFSYRYYSKEIIEDVKINPVIVHFNGSEKPWHYVNLHPFKDKFTEYLKISGLKNNFDEERTLRKMLKKLVYRVYGWSNWYKI